MKFMENNTSLVPPQKTAAEKTKRNHFWGIFLLVFPYPGLILVLTLYAILAFSSVNATDSRLLLNVSKQILSFLGLICMAGIPIGLPLGIYLLVKKVPEDKKPEDNNRLTI
jgi:hypothetical protein